MKLLLLQRLSWVVFPGMSLEISLYEAAGFLKATPWGFWEKACLHRGCEIRPGQLTLEQHGLELCWSTYMQHFLNKHTVGPQYPRGSHPQFQPTLGCRRSSVCVTLRHVISGSWGPVDFDTCLGSWKQASLDTEGLQLSFGGGVEGTCGGSAPLTPHVIQRSTVHFYRISHRQRMGLTSTWAFCTAWNNLAFSYHQPLHTFPARLPRASKRNLSSLGRWTSISSHVGAGSKAWELIAA